MNASAKQSSNFFLVTQCEGVVCVGEVGGASDAAARFNRNRW